MDRNRLDIEGVLTTKATGRKNRQPSGDIPTRKSSGVHESKENNVAPDSDGSARAIPRPITRTGTHKSEIPHASPSPGSRLDRGASIFETPRSSRSTRIPRPRTTTPVAGTHQPGISNNPKLPIDQSSDSSSPMRQPMNLKAAFRRAQEQAAAEVTGDSDNTLDLPHAFDMANLEFNAIHGTDGSPSRPPRPLRRELKSPASYNRVGTKPIDLNEHLERFDRNHHLRGNTGPLAGLFLKNHAAPKALETGRIATTKTTGYSLGSPSKQRTDLQATSPRQQGSAERNRALAKRLSAVNAYLDNVDANAPIPLIDSEHAGDIQPSPNFGPAGPSPDKSTNWHLEADFTAEDLEFSESPRITVGKSDSDPSHQMGMSDTRRGNDRLSKIHQREVEVAKMALPEDGTVATQMNHRLDEVRVREMEALSRRSMASSRLDEIRIKNSEPRSGSPEIHRASFKGPLAEESSTTNAKAHISSRPSSDPEPRSELIRGTAIRAKNPSGRKLSISEQDRVQESEEQRGSPSTTDSHDLLRRLARVTGSSPVEKLKRTEQTKDISSSERTGAEQLSETRNRTRSPLSHREKGVRNLEVKNSKDRPTVGFVGLEKIPSSDSLETKQSSKPTSEVDPTDRIHSELDLFAPSDNYSEKSSIRAPSPVVSKFRDEETPRPPKIDPLMQPTPLVSGAYVDTPATVRRIGEANLVAPELGLSTRSQTHSLSPVKDSSDSSSAVRTRSLKRAGPRSSSVPTASRRSSSSLRRRQPLVNTAKPPTVREDILTILRANEIDDSTLENLDSLPSGRDIKSESPKHTADDAVLKVENDLDAKFSEMTNSERELEVYDRMSKTLQTGLLGIRSAKKGIEDLEDKVTHSSGKSDQTQPKDKSSNQPAPQPPSATNGTAPILISIPRLYHREPRFKLTGLGIFAILVLIWYALESTFSFLYAGPEYICTPTIPCDWSPNEPYFPYTMPFILDEWATGGKGRALALTMGEEAGDMFAEVTDWVTNTDFTQSDELYMDVWQRKRHRRRLRKHGLIPKWTEPLGYKSNLKAWQAEKAARELAQEYGFDPENAMMSDDRVAR